jgi:hypothetical protein
LLRERGKSWGVAPGRLSVEIGRYISHLLSAMCEMKNILIDVQPDFLSSETFVEIFCRISQKLSPRIVAIAKVTEADVAKREAPLPGRRRVSTFQISCLRSDSSTGLMDLEQIV